MRERSILELQSRIEIEVKEKQQLEVSIIELKRAQKPVADVDALMYEIYELKK